ncbi:multidrug effflux MFS transporter [Sphingomonas sp. KC8]|uniref:multidrug effflux MFS transporter n=1 Tax=Sphingomonas sp. KC8 TaxID=1030157 RepID=UPI000248A00C|nr:multidrug effflux MFS transporter [Sphingomonas sp. KC8]ARS29143.1 Bcr/CflA subfamily drug resistance transporter [Sphingomonas sp. KC8]
MSQATGDHGGAPSFRMGFREFVALVAMLMAINALGIDSMLPALPAMGAALDIVSENQRQWIIAAYVFGFGSTQLIYGPLADRYGRKPVLIISMSLFVATSLLAAFAWDFQSIIAARVLQGVCAAASRVLAISIVRDRYSGRQMARVMSLSFVVFLAVPILAPSIGQLILLVAPWPAIFLFLAAFGALLVIWASLRLPETLHPDDRRQISVAKMASAARVVLGNRYSLGYTLASTMLFGALMGFINSVQQIFADIFREPTLFPIIFASVAASMGIASYLNSRIVERLGTRLVSHSALIGFILFSTIHVAVALSGHETLLTFALLQAATMACFGLAGSNFGSMAMEPVGHFAGIASSIQGFTSTLGGAALGIIIGQSYNGTTIPIALGYMLLGMASLVIVLIVERGRLFRAHHPAPAHQPDA